MRYSADNRYTLVTQSFGLIRQTCPSQGTEHAVITAMRDSTVTCFAVPSYVASAYRFDRLGHSRVFVAYSYQLTQIARWLNRIIVGKLARHIETGRYSPWRRAI